MPSPSTNSQQSNIVEELQDLLGSPVVFIAWPRGVKGSRRKWRDLNPSHMTSEYLAKLPRGNIGVALGEVSGGLCAIDIDSEDFVAPFEHANPWTARTLQTHGSRGRVFWVRISGDYPASSKLKAIGGVVGEFRATGNQSIVWGIHPDTKQPYKRILPAPAVCIAYDEIRWPAGVVPPLLQSSGVKEQMSSRADDAVCVRAVVSCSGSIPLQFSHVQPACGVQGLTDAMRSKVESCLPTGPHQNNRLLFQLARRLKFVEGISNAALTEAFNLWHERTAALGFLRSEQSKDDYAGEFWQAVAKAKTPPQIFESAVKLARSSPLPPEASLFESEPGKLVCAICYQFHLQTPEGETWYLPCRKCHDELGIHWTSVARYLARLVGASVIEMREPARMSHIPSERRAARYVWKGSSVEN